MKKNNYSSDNETDLRPIQLLSWERERKRAPTISITQIDFTDWILYTMQCVMDIIHSDNIALYNKDNNSMNANSYEKIDCVQYFRSFIAFPKTFRSTIYVLIVFFSHWHSRDHWSFLLLFYFYFLFVYTFSFLILFWFHLTITTSTSTTTITKTKLKGNTFFHHFNLIISKV